MEDPSRNGQISRRYWLLAGVAVPLFQMRGGEPFAITFDGDNLHVSAPTLHFLSGRPLARLKDGATVVYLSQLTLFSDAYTTVLGRSMDRFVISYDIWADDKFSVTIPGVRSPATFRRPLPRRGVRRTWRSMPPGWPPSGRSGCNSTCARLIKRSWRRWSAGWASAWARSSTCWPPSRDRTILHGGGRPAHYGWQTWPAHRAGGRETGDRLRNRLILIFLAATLGPLFATVWITNWLLEQSLSYATTTRWTRFRNRCSVPATSCTSEPKPISNGRRWRAKRSPRFMERPIARAGRRR